jgi:NAD(P)-dependent dehydrogenase (short-subunit alcohol dehydrogenase family)
MPENTAGHIVVVGGTSGLGFAIAKAALAKGSTVTITGRDAARAESVAATLGKGATGRALNLLASDSIKSALADGPPIAGLVITAIERVSTTAKDFSPVDAERIARAKVVGYPEVVHRALPRLAPTSSVVLFGGVARLQPYPGSTMVSAVNGAVVGLTATLAVELAPIRVNSISPGIVGDTAAWQAVRAKDGGAMLDQLAARTPSRRLTQTADIVHACFFLLENPAVNGIDLLVDGGITLV